MTERSELRESRPDAGFYYDLNPDFPNDIPFYLERLPAGEPRVLELGCGTGRVALPLALRSGFLHGVDLSAAMVAVCRNRFRDAGLGPERAQASVGDISSLTLGDCFDYIAAPFRVIQNVITDPAIEGLFAGIRAHLAPGGRCVLNAFRPYADPVTMLGTWTSGEESVEWEVPVEGGRVIRSVRRVRIDPKPLVVHPELIHRRFRGDELVEEVVLPIAMRCWYPGELLTRITNEGFSVTGTWGGYHGEAYGDGPELIVEFT